MKNINVIVLVKSVSEKVVENNDKLVNLLSQYENLNFYLTYSTYEGLDLSNLNTYGAGVLFSNSKKESVLIESVFNQIKGNIMIVDLENDDLINIVKKILKSINDSKNIFISDKESEFRVIKVINSILRFFYSHFCRILGVGKPLFVLTNFQYFDWETVRDIQFSKEPNLISRNYYSSEDYEYLKIDINKDSGRDMLRNIDNKNIGVIVGKIGIGASIIISFILSFFYSSIQSLNNGIYIHLLLFVLFILITYLSLFLISKNIIKNILNKWGYKWRK